MLPGGRTGNRCEGQNVMLAPAHRTRGKVCLMEGSSVERVCGP
jgi:hypothetical protein